ncbi:hypothetical protein [Emcibacter nanhaiensis]|uniref:Uncharacterized protein n=1 Tax=Emcibacter nanhaiensis TaxID=1505037 RepID=A0A501PMA5_9PROT|nr:hypothetical protein [Emcibacter nanhaiensis]TPD61405.1 hypothetical protein FIV46_04135 [Emcibacter nanhaiensis]
MARKFLLKTLLAGLVYAGFLQFVQAQPVAQDRPDPQATGEEVPAESSDGTTDDFLPADEPPKSILFPDSEPGPYFPAQSPDANGLPVPLDAGSRTGGAEVITSDVPGLDGEVEVAELGEEDPASFGLITERNGGFRRSMWIGSSREKVILMMSALPASAKSPVMHELVDRLLLSAAQVPAGDGTGGAGSSYLDARIAAIRGTGDLKNLSSFFQILPEGTLAPSRDTSDILLLAGDLSAACRMTRRAIDDISQSAERTYWLKMLAYCRALEGNADGAGLALELLQENGNTDYGFVDLINKLLAGGDTAADVMPYGYGSLDPLTYSLLSTLGQAASPELLAQSSPLVLYAVAGNANLARDIRLEAASRAWDQGWFPVKTLRAIYNLQEFAASELDSAETLATVDETALADVLLYQAAAVAEDPQKKAELLKTIWARALEKNDLARVARLNAATVSTLQPSAELVQHTHHIVRALLLAGNRDKALAWYQFIRGEAFAGNADATKALVDIWPLLLVTEADGTIPWSMDILDLWWNGQMILSRAERDDKAALFYSLVEALDRQVPEEMWQQVGPGGLETDIYSMQPAVWRSLVQAARDGRLGETVLLSLVGLGPHGPAALDGTGLSAVIRALRSYGLEAEARAVALEALASRGF